LRRRKRIYEPIFEQSLAAALASTETRLPRAEVARLCNRLEALRKEQIRLWLTNSSSCRRPEVVTELLDRCLQTNLIELPAQSLERAQLALAVALACLPACLESANPRTRPRR
jgi:hypothetical protein